MLKAVEAITRGATASKQGRRVFIDYFLSLPPVADQSFADSLVKVVQEIPEDDWTTVDLNRLRLRTNDNWELAEGLLGITAARVDEARQDLLGDLGDGRTRMLKKVPDLRIIPETVAAAQISTLSESVVREAEEARAGTFYRRDGRSLAMLNLWHPRVANWAPIVDLLQEFRVMPASIISLVRLIRDASTDIQPDVRDQLLPLLQNVRDRIPIDLAEWTESNDRVRTVAREAIDALSPGTVSDPEIWGLVGGDSAARSAAARIVGRRQDLSRLDILACLSSDQATIVRGHAAHWIARWLAHEEVAARCNALLEVLAAAPGTLIVGAIATGLKAASSHGAAGDWLATLPSATEGEFTAQ